MRKVAFVIGIEEYLDKNINSVGFAQNDVLEIVDTLKRIGLAEDEITTLVSKGATKTVINSKLNRLISSLTEEDIIYFYYAGHGFSKDNINYITCYDTLLDDSVKTSIALQDIIKQFKESTNKKSILFIDSCSSGLPLDTSSRGLYSHLSEEELSKFLFDAEGCICFSACKDDEESHSHQSIKHGIWSFHVIQALSGNAPTALENGNIITPASLQNYLSIEVPLTLRRLKIPGYIQTPWMNGALSRDMLIADVGHIVNEKKQKKAPIVRQLKNAIISSVKIESVRSLSGFVKGSHKVPNEANGATQRFIENISKNEIKDIVNDIHNGLRKYLKYKRRDIEVSLDMGNASISAPHFEYHVEVTIDQDDPSKVTFHEFIQNISDGYIILSDAFNSAFEHGFNSIKFFFQDNISIKDTIDSLEEIDDSKFELKYDASYTKIEINIDGYNADIIIESDKLVISVIRPVAPKILLPIIEDGLKHINSKEQLKMLPLIGEDDGT